MRESFLWGPVLSQAWWCALIAFTLNTAAYTTELFRGAIEATPAGEIEAAKACGLSYRKRLARIILPGAFRRALPAYSNEVIFMLHGSVVASTITLQDILGVGAGSTAATISPMKASSPPPCSTWSWCRSLLTDSACGSAAGSPICARAPGPWRLPRVLLSNVRI